MNTRVDTRVLEIRHQRFIVCVDLLDILPLSHQSLESFVCSILCRVFTSTVTALLKLSDTRTFERYPVVSGAYDSSNVDGDRQTGSLG